MSKFYATTSINLSKEELTLIKRWAHGRYWRRALRIKVMQNALNTRDEFCLPYSCVLLVKRGQSIDIAELDTEECPFGVLEHAVFSNEVCDYKLFILSTIDVNGALEKTINAITK